MSTIPRREPDPSPDLGPDPLCDHVERLERLLSICEQFDDAWLSGEAPEIEDFLARVPDGLRAELFRELLGLEISNRIGAGQSPTPEAYLGRFPEHTGQIVALFQASATPGPALLESGPPVAPGSGAGYGLGDDEGATEVLLQKNALPFPFPLRPPSLGLAARDDAEHRSRYKHLRTREVGGMGRVSQVYDRVLRRIVAIKEIKPAYGRNPLYRERFLREARITGALIHPSVVPIHSVEAYSDGTPYYVMRWVDGEEFRDVIRAFHKARTAPDGPAAMTRNSREFRRVLGQFVEVCNVIQSAHDQGVMHRDIKPVNVMIGRHGEVVVLDWGLARFIDPVRERLVAAAEAEAAAERPDADPSPDPAPMPVSTVLDAESLDVHPELTTAGDFQGTPGYASPEHYGHDPDGLDARSDVFSLGASLYVLLTNQNPFRAEEKPTDDVVRQRVLAGAFARPSALVKGIHPDLEAICLKAMATKPDDRYPSVRALADDVENWLADQPISARKTPALGRLTRQARHQSKAVIAVTSVLLAIIVGLVFGNYSISGARDLLWNDLQAVLNANNAMLQSVTQGPLSTAPGAETLRQDIALRLVNSYNTLLKTSPDRDEVREKLAYAAAVLANIHRQLGEYDLANTRYGESIRHRLKVVERSGRRPDQANELLGTAADAFKNIHAGHSFEKARDGWALLRTDLAWAIEAVTDPVIRARVFDIEAEITAKRGQVDQAIPLQRKAIATLGSARESLHPSLYGMVSMELSSYHATLGAQLAQIGQVDEAEAQFREAQRVAQEGQARGGQDLRTSFKIPEGRRALARGRMLRKDPARRAEALREFEAAYAACDELARTYPASVGFKRDAWYAAIEIAETLKDADAAAESRRAVEACESAVRLAREIAGDSLEGGRISPLVIGLVELDEALDRTLGFDKHPHDPMAEAKSLLERARDFQGSDLTRTPAEIRYNRSGPRFAGPRDTPLKSSLDDD